MYMAVRTCMISRHNSNNSIHLLLSSRCLHQVISHTLDPRLRKLPSAEMKVLYALRQVLRPDLPLGQGCQNGFDAGPIVMGYLRLSDEEEGSRHQP